MSRMVIAINRRVPEEHPEPEQRQPVGELHDVPPRPEAPALEMPEPSPRPPAAREGKP
jgi:hypothetical protein